MSKKCASQYPIAFLSAYWKYYQKKANIRVIWSCIDVSDVYYIDWTIHFHPIYLFIIILFRSAVNKNQINHEWNEYSFYWHVKWDCIREYYVT